MNPYQPRARQAPAPYVLDEPQRRRRPRPRLQRQPQLTQQPVLPVAEPQSPSAGLAPGYTLGVSERGISNVLDPDGNFVANEDSLDSALSYHTRNYHAAVRDGDDQKAQMFFDAANQLRAARGFEPLAKAVSPVSKEGVKPWELPQFQDLNIPVPTEEPQVKPRELPQFQDLNIPPPASGPMSYLTGAGDAVTGVIENTIDNLFPAEDPNFAGVGGIADFDIATPATKMAAVSDAAYGDVIKKNLGDRLIKSEQDSEGREVLTYRDFRGDVKRGYINEPGLDWQDVDRVVMSALPYVAGGAVGGMATKGALPFVQALGQAIPAAGVSLSQDVVAEQMGSKQGLDFARAIASGGLAGAASYFGPIGGGMAAGGLLGASQGETTGEQIAGGLFGALGGGFIGSKAKQMFAEPKPNHAINGQLATPEAQIAARKLGLIDDVTPELDPATASRFGDNLAQAADPIEAGVVAQTERFRIPTTKGQRTKSPRQLMAEKDMRYGTFGDEAERVLKEFDARQARAIEKAGFSRADEQWPGQDISDPARLGVGEVIAPGRGYLGSSAVRRDELGRTVADGLVQAKKAGDTAIGQAWDDVGRVYPRQESFQDLGRMINAKMIHGPDYDQASMQNARSMVDTLKSFQAGEEVPVGIGIGNPETRRMDLDFVRRRLLANKGGQTPQERSITNSIYNGFEEWMDVLAERGMLVGDPSNVAKIRTARQVTREVKGLFDLRNPDGRQSAGGRIMKDVLERADTPEQVLSALLGGTGPTAVPKAGTVQAIDAYRRALFQGTGGMKVDPQVAMRSWNDLRMAYWSRLITNKDGSMATPTMISKNVASAFTQQRSLVRGLFTPEELGLMKQYARAASEASYKDPNPSGTASAIRAQNARDGAVSGTLRTFLQTQSKRELFSKHNVMMSRFYQLLAKNIPKQFFGTNTTGFGGKAAARAVDQEMTRRVGGSNFGGVGAFAAPALEPTAARQRNLRF